MIIERPGAKNDRDYVLSNIDNDRHNNMDTEKFGDNYEAAFGKFVPWWEKDSE